MGQFRLKADPNSTNFDRVFFHRTLLEPGGAGKQIAPLSRVAACAIGFAFGLYALIPPRRWRGAFLFVLLFVLVVSEQCKATGLFFRIEDQIGATRIESLRRTIPLLNDIAAEKIRYYDVPGLAIFLRLEDERYCVENRCLNLIVDEHVVPPRYLAVFSSNSIFIAPQLVTLGGDDRKADRGVLVFFLDDPRSKDIRVFLSEKVIAILP